MPYVKQTWENGDIITAAKLNHMEDGISDAENVLVVKGILGDRIDETSYHITLDKTYEEIFAAEYPVITFYVEQVILVVLQCIENSFVSSIVMDGVYYQYEISFNTEHIPVLFIQETPITPVTANPTLAGTEAALTGLQVGVTKYGVPKGLENFDIEFNSLSNTEIGNKTQSEVLEAINNGKIIRIKTPYDMITPYRLNYITGPNYWSIYYLIALSAGGAGTVTIKTGEISNIKTGSDFVTLNIFTYSITTN